MQYLAAVACLLSRSVMILPVAVRNWREGVFFVDAGF